MGIQNLYKVIIANRDSKYNGMPISCLYKPMTEKDFRGKKLCCDAFNIIYEVMNAKRDQLTSDGTPTGMVTTHIHGIFQKVKMIRSWGAGQIWIFDNPVKTNLKLKTVGERYSAKMKTYEKTGVYPFFITVKIIEDVKKLLTLMGIPYIVAPPEVEAELFAATLIRGDAAPCTHLFSGDTDGLLVGCPTISRRSIYPPSKDGETPSKRKISAYYLLDPDVINRELGLTQAKFVEMCVALGTDFSKKVAGVGPSNCVVKARVGTLGLAPVQKIAIDYINKSISSVHKEYEVSGSVFNLKGLVSWLVEELGFDRNKMIMQLRSAKFDVPIEYDSVAETLGITKAVIPLPEPLAVIEKKSSEPSSASTNPASRTEPIAIGPIEPIKQIEHVGGTEDVDILIEDDI